MNVNIADFYLVLPEALLLVAACAAILAELFFPSTQRSYLLVQLSLVGAFALLLTGFHTPQQVAFSGLLVSDYIARLLKLFIVGMSFFALLYARTYVSERIHAQPEYYILSLYAVLGMCVLVSAHSMLTVYLGLELLSLPLYALVALQRDVSTRTEAAMKYFIMGAIASGILLYGMSMFYGATGSLDIANIATAVAGTPEDKRMILYFGLVFLIVGIGFKFAAFPFHMWAPDVYHGAPTSVTLFLGSVPKLAAMGMLLRLIVQMLPALMQQWQLIFTVMAVGSMFFGNLFAIAQDNFKRMLAYSSIAHIGYMLLGLIAGTQEGFAAALFYILVYALSSMAGFAMLLMLSREGFDAENLEDFRGLNQRSPWYAFMLLLVMFSMAGIPPLVGFFAKFAVLKALVAVNMIWLAVLSLVFAIIGIFYYIRVVRLMYFDSPVETAALTCTKDMQLAISLNGGLLLFLGLFPTALYQLCIRAFI